MNPRGVTTKISSDDGQPLGGHTESLHTRRIGVSPGEAGLRTNIGVCPPLDSADMKTSEVNDHEE